MCSYRQLSEANNEQIGVGRLNIHAGGQFDGLIGGLAWQIGTNESTEFIRQPYQKFTGNKSKQ